MNREQLITVLVRSKYSNFVWNKLGNLLFRTIQQAIKDNLLHASARKGILSFIPKKDKDPMLMQNWRPITLMSTDHKILAKIIANRIQPVMHYLISEQQTGYIQGRFIGLNIRKLIDVLTYVESENIPAILITIDFRKAFDTVEFTAIEGILDYLGFGPYIKKLIFLLYTQFEMYVSHNGKLSNSFYPQRGIHQGCAASGYIFVLIAEALSHMLKQNSLIHPISINGVVDLLSQYIDDITVFTLYQEQSIKEIIEVFEIFAKNTGLCVNYEKSVIYKVGAAKIMPNIKLKQKFKWETENINVLGINLDDPYKSIEDIIIKMRATLTQWKRHGLSIIGKINVINALVGSMLVYFMQCAPSISGESVKKIIQILIDFIWNARKPKIRIDILQARKDNYGISLFDPLTKDCSLKIAWVKRINELSPFSHELVRYHIKPILKNAEFWNTNTHVNDIGTICKAKGFWYDVVKSWCIINYHEVKDINTIMHQRLWYNSHICIKNEPYIIRKLADKGIYQVLDIVYNQGQLMSLSEITDTYAVNLNYLDYFSMITAIPDKWKKVIGMMTVNINELTLMDCCLVEKIVEFKKVSKYAYDDLISRADNSDIIHKWNSVLDKQALDQGFQFGKITQITKYQSFQFRLMHKAIWLNPGLYYSGLSKTKNCSFCEEVKETYQHFFYKCQYVKALWNDLDANFQKKCYENQTLTITI